MKYMKFLIFAGIIITIVILIILAAVTIKSIYDTRMVKLGAEGANKYAEEQIKESKLIDSVQKSMDEYVLADGTGAINKSIVDGKLILGIRAKSHGKDKEIKSDEIIAKDEDIINTKADLKNFQK